MGRAIESCVGTREENKGVNMKKLLTGIVVTACMTGLAFACGGMTQIDPPNTSDDAGAEDKGIDSVVDSLTGIVVLC